MGKLISIWEFICRRKYLITIVAFAVIIVFLDENSLLRRLGYEREISQLKEEIEKYRADYEENTKRLNEISTNPDAIEQIAREKYLMKKPNDGPHRSSRIHYRLDLCTLHIYYWSRIHCTGTSKHPGKREKQDTETSPCSADIRSTRSYTDWCFHVYHTRQ